MKNFASFSVALVLSALALPAQSQQYLNQYHYNSGGSRVVNQRNVGLNQPASTQITTGTLSPSAQGINQVGEQANPLLPKVPWGSTVTTPGDQQYGRNFQAPPQVQMVRINQGGRIVTAPVMVVGAGGNGSGGPTPAAPCMIMNNGLPAAPFGSHVGTPGDSMRSDLHPEVNRYNDAWWHPQPVMTRTAAPAVYVPSGAAGAATYDDGQHTKALSY
jgi:hypothetical protein